MADAKTLYLLLESAAGYALFDVVEYDEIGGLLDDVTEVKRFGRVVKVKAFQPFESAQDALENANAISEHAMTSSLHHFLEQNLPQAAFSSKSSSSKKTTPAISLGVLDSGLATAIAEGLVGISCRSDDTVRELIRGCRLHLPSLVKGLDNGAAEKAQLGLGHSYSRSKVKFNPARSDNMIIQSIALLDQMEKDVNTFAMRIREWYSWHFPELKELVKDNIMFARAAAYIQDKGSLLNTTKTKEADDDEDEEDEKAGDDADGPQDKLPGLIEIVGDEETARAIVNAARTSMGMDCSAVDMVNIINFTQRMVKLAEFRKRLSGYLTDKMDLVAPNLSALIGDVVAARLISKAGSLTNLAKAPASTVQILGAEKALFRALKTKGNTPKYGLIYHSTFIGRANAKNKGRMSRYLANKCAIATRIDSFSDGTPSRLYGEKLRDQVEERLQFYETGAAPRRNMDVMQEVAKQLKEQQGGDEDEDAMQVDTPTKKDKKKKKKDKKESKKRKAEDDEDEEEATPLKTPESKKKKRKAEDEVEGKSSKKKAKKAKKEKGDDDEPSSEKKAKKEKKKKRKSKD